MNIFKKAKALDETNESVSIQPEPKLEEWIWVEGYKGTDKNMCCRDYQYELGKQYDMPKDVEIQECKSGFHLCLKLEDVFSYYSIGNGNRFFKVKALVRKSHAENYRKSVCIGNAFYSMGHYDKLVAKSIMFISELTIDEILKDTKAEGLPEEYKQAAVECGVEFAVNNYQINTLVEDGYSQAFAIHLVKDGTFSIAHAIGSQKDLSMDVKVLAILYHKKEN